jgi:hypothetical protein
MTVGKAPPDINFRYPETRLLQGLCAHQLLIRAPRVGGELVPVGGQQPIGADTA